MRRSPLMAVATVRPRTWPALLETLYAESWNERLGRFRSPYAFHGRSRVGGRLSSGLLRLSAGRADVARLELHLLRNFRKYAYLESGDHSIWHWLALAQHRGLPTRLLDWTYSPFVALHFATANVALMDDDACVWMVNFVEANRLLPPRLKRILQAEGSDTATVDMLRPFTSLREFDRLARDPFVIFFEPPSLDPRIVNQFALFSLMSGPDAELDDWIAAHPRLVRLVVVPRSLKWEVRDKLDQANIDERVLFPGLDGLTRWLTRYYWQNPVARSSGPKRARKKPAQRGRLRRRQV